MKEFEHMTLTALADWWNENTPEDKHVKKFAKKSDAVRRCSALAKEIRGTHAGRSAAIQESWRDEKVAAARMVRHACKVDGTVYKSVLAAYRALNINDKDHISFRQLLKDPAGAEIRNHGHVWQLVPYEEYRNNG